MTVFSIIRLVVLATTLLFSVVVLGISAHLIWLTTNYLAVYFTFAAMSIASAVLTVFTVPVMIAIDFTRQGAFTSKIWVELSWLGILWVLWLASAGLAADANGKIFSSGCGYANDTVDTACKEFAAITAFTFLTWIALFGYTIMIFVLTLIAQSRGNSVWGSSVRNADFLASGATGTTAEKTEFAPEVMQTTPFIVTPQHSGIPPQYPPQQQAQYPVQHQQPQYVPQQTTPASGWAGQPQTQPSPQPSYPQV